MKIRITENIMLRAKRSEGNRSIAAALHRKGERYPVAQTSFRTGTTAEQLKDWATTFINNPNKQFLFT
jgi:hypothetical protein